MMVVEVNASRQTTPRALVTNHDDTVNHSLIVNQLSFLLSNQYNKIHLECKRHISFTQMQPCGITIPAQQASAVSIACEIIFDSHKVLQIAPLFMQYTYNSVCHLQE